MRQTYWIVGLLLAIPASGCLEAVPAPVVPAPVDPAALAGQVELRLTANQDTYCLAIPAPERDGERPAYPQVDLTVELLNRSDAQVVIPIGTRDWYTLKLEGPGANAATEHGMWCIPSPDITVEAGKSHVTPLRQLRYFRGKGATVGHWTKTGDYTLTAEAQVRVQGQEVTVRSKPLALKVVEGPPAPPAGERPAAQALRPKPALVLAEQADAKKDAPWEKLFENEDWYKGAAGKEQVFRGKLEAIPDSGAATTLQRTSYYKLGDRTLYTGAKKVPALDKLVGKEVEIRGKPVDMNLEGRSLKEIWPAAVRPQ